MGSRKITIKVENKELDAFEDFLTIKMSKEKKKKVKKRCLNLLIKLIHEYDK